MSAQAILFLLAGYENTANTLALVFHLLAMHPEHQDNLRKEIIECSNRFVDDRYKYIAAQKDVF